MSSSVSNYTNTSRITGLVSGIDVDSTVKQLMEAEKQPLYKLQQKKQLAEWRQDAYREVINKLRAFNDTYFNYTGTSGNMLSQSAYEQFSTTSTDASVVSVTAGSGAAAGSHTVSISSLATAASYKSIQKVTKDITASSAANFSNMAGKSFVIDIDGTETTVGLDASVTDIESLQSAIDAAVGSGKIKVSDSNGDGTGYLTISKVEGSGVGTIALSSGTGSSALSAMGFSSSDELSNYLDTTDTLEEISARLGNSFSFDSEGYVKLTINGVSFEFSKSTTLKKMINEINNSEAGVTMKYNALSDTFSVTADKTGAGNKISMSESGSTFLQGAGITSYTAGKDAVVEIDGQKLTRSSNTVTLDGVTYSLKAEGSSQQTVTVSADTDAVYDRIKSFIDDYNSLISDINEEISEEYDRDYPPLTDAQKDEMSDDEIASWEKKAKTGLLEGDSTLKSLLSNMRSALYESVQGVSAHLTEIGITTSSNYQNKGKLIINESKLRTAIESDAEGVMNLFSQQSASYPGTTSARNLTSTQRQTRSSEEGLAYRLYDILQDSISTYTGISGKKGSLIEKAGLEGDGSEYSNLISDQLDKYSEEIDDMTERLDAKEDKYYKQFSLMETYINQMNSQLTSFQSYLE